jgi:hypothetical protein
VACRFFWPALFGVVVGGGWWVVGGGWWVVGGGCISVICGDADYGSALENQNQNQKQKQKYRLCESCRSALARDLPGTGSKTCACGVIGRTESPDFTTAARQIAGKRAPTGWRAKN